MFCLVTLYTHRLHYEVFRTNKQKMIVGDGKWKAKPIALQFGIAIVTIIIIVSFFFPLVIHDSDETKKKRGRKRKKEKNENGEKD